MECAGSVRFIKVPSRPRPHCVQSSSITAQSPSIIPHNLLSGTIPQGYPGQEFNPFRGPFIKQSDARAVITVIAHTADIKVVLSTHVLSLSRPRSTDPVQRRVHQRSSYDDDAAVELSTFKSWTWYKSHPRMTLLAPHSSSSKSSPLSKRSPFYNVHGCWRKRLNGNTESRVLGVNPLEPSHPGGKLPTYLPRHKLTIAVLAGTESDPGCCSHELDLVTHHLVL